MTEETGQPPGDECSPFGVPIPFTPADTKRELDQVVHELEHESDRAAAVLAAAWLEWRVRQAIRARLHVWDSNVETIFGTDEKPGQLGFTHQGRMAYGLGLIGPIGLKDLEKVAQVRNRFAHRIAIRSFNDDEKIRGLCKSLQSPELAPDPPTEELSLRDRYMHTAGMLNLMLWLQVMPDTSQFVLCKDGEALEDGRFKGTRMRREDLFW